MTKPRAAKAPAANGGRIARRFAALREAGRAGLATFFTAGDPDLATSLALIKALPAAGADLIEIGMPFSDPMADGPAIQAASLRALKAGGSLRGTLALVRDFRAGDQDTPIILMGYYNPIYRYGPEPFARDAAKAGVDGLILVDLPPEEEDELRPAADKAGLALIRLVAPTTGPERLGMLLERASGFIYCISITGVTGTRSAKAIDVAATVEGLRARTSLPIVVGFGIKTPADAAAIARVADAAAVGSALVQALADRLDKKGKAKPALVPELVGLVRKLANAVHGARVSAAAGKPARAAR